MSVADLKARTQQIFDMYNAHDAEAAAAFFAPDAIFHDTGAAQPLVGSQAIAALYHRHYRGIPDAHVRVDRVVAEHDTVMVEWTSSGTHRGKLLGIPPTGKYVSFKGVSVLRYRGGLVIAGTRIWDMAGLLRQLGLLPKQEEL
jgi:steroid delta-isomerase-like uncharacterized protein